MLYYAIIDNTKGFLLCTIDKEDRFIDTNTNEVVVPKIVKMNTVDSAVCPFLIELLTFARDEGVMPAIEKLEDWRDAVEELLEIMGNSMRYNDASRLHSYLNDNLKQLVKLCTVQ